MVTPGNFIDFSKTMALENDARVKKSSPSQNLDNESESEVFESVLQCVGLYKHLTPDVPRHVNVENPTTVPGSGTL